MTNERREMFGRQACEVGTPDYDVNDPQTNAVDTIANVLHHLTAQGGNANAAIDSARMHYEAEQAGED